MRINWRAGLGAASARALESGCPGLAGVLDGLLEPLAEDRLTAAEARRLLAVRRRRWGRREGGGGRGEEGWSEEGWSEDGGGRALEGGRGRRRKEGSVIPAQLNQGGCKSATWLGRRGSRYRGGAVGHTPDRRSGLNAPPAALVVPG